MRDVSASNYSLFADMVQVMYPVGSVYISVNNSNPNILFPETVWEQIEGKFLLGSSTNYQIGDEGGAVSISYTPAGSVDSHTLTTNEIPSHSHGLNGHTHGYSDYGATTTGGKAISWNEMPVHSHDLPGERYAQSGSNTYTLASVGANVPTDCRTKDAGSGWSHSHSGNNTSYSRTSDGNSGNTTSVGGAADIHMDSAARLRLYQQCRHIQL